MLSKCPPSLRYTNLAVSSTIPSNSLASSRGAKRGEAHSLSSGLLGFTSHQPRRTLNMVIRKAVAGVVLEPQFGLAAAPEIATAVAILIPPSGKAKVSVGTKPQ